MIAAVLALLFLWVLCGAVWLAVWPFFRAAAPIEDPAVVERRELETQKAILLAEIHELELDRDTGKLSDEDFRELEARLKGRAVEVMRRIDRGAGVDQTGSLARTTR